MEINLISSTGNLKTKEEMIRFGRDSARICYSEYDFDQLQAEEDNTNLANILLQKGHHSPYEHIHLAFYFKELPKIGAMILNNEKVYVTSEKSARYTIMKPTPKQEVLYSRWMSIFKENIEKKYPLLPDRTKTNLAKENARYLTSVFTPTKMMHTVSFRQLNYIMHFFNKFQNEAEDTLFNNRVKEFMGEFNQILLPFYDERLTPEDKRRRLSLFAKRKKFTEEFGENYSTTFPISFAGLAQEHRHRTLGYEIQTPKQASSRNDIFVPPILEDNSELLKMWIEDILNVAQNDFPQGQLVQVHEFGNYSDFLSKATERLCAHAQWEIMNATRNTLDNYLKTTKDNNPEIYAELNNHSYGPKCTVSNIICKDPCTFGIKGLERLV